MPDSRIALLVYLAVFTLCANITTAETNSQIPASLAERLFSNLDKRESWPSNGVKIWLANPNVSAIISAADNKTVEVHAWPLNSNDFNVAMMRLDRGDTLYAITGDEFMALQQHESLTTLNDKYNRLDAFIGDEVYGPGGSVVLKVAYEALRDKHAAGEAPLVGLEDVWSHALQEGLALFNKPDQLWGRTTAEQTADMIGQTTIGPWQMTLWNIRDNYGPRYGIDPEWDNNTLYAFCREHPDIQAKMIIDYIQLSYETFGQRTPYAIQRYFWLEPFVKGELGQAEDWTKSVVAKPPPGGTWKDLTPAMKADTGFYAKQVLLGTPYTNSGLLFWLNVTEDTDAAKQVLRTWRDQRRIVVADDKNVSDQQGMMKMENIHYRLTDEPGGFAIQPDDVIYYKDRPKLHQAVRQLVAEVLEEQP